MPCQEFLRERPSGAGKVAWSTNQPFSMASGDGGRPVLTNKRLILAHFWLAFIVFLARRWRSVPGRCSCAAR